MITNERFDYIISSLYEAATEPFHWQTALDLCAKYLGGIDVLLLTIDTKTNQQTSCISAEPSIFNQKNVRNYPITVTQLIFLMDDALIGELRCSRLAHVQSAGEEENFDDPLFYKERHVLASRVHENDSHHSLLALFRCTDYPAFSEKEQQSSKRIGFHIGNALSQQSYFESVNRKAKLNTKIIDSLAFSIFIINDKGEIQYLNRSAKLMLSLPDSVLYINNNRCLCPVEVIKNNEMKSLMRISTENNIRLMTLNGMKTVHLFFQSVRYDDLSWVKLVLIPTQQQSDGMSKGLSEIYSLTHSELQLTNALLQGQSLKEYSQSKNISLNTVRSHLKMVFKKTNTCKQSELIALLCQLPSFMPSELKRLR